jgi:hypothetical protein
MSILVLTSDTLIGTPATGNLEYNGQFFGTDSAGSRAQMQRITQGTAVASTSGTSIDFTGLPAWVKRITVMFNGVSTNGSSFVQVQLGSGSVTTSGYYSAASDIVTSVTTSTSTTGLLFTKNSAAADIRVGAMTITNISGNIWISTATSVLTNAAVSNVSAGNITLSGTLDRIRITTVNGTDTFDAGSVNILYEG